MQLIYDVAVVLIVVFCVGTGYKRGVLRTFLSLACFVIAFGAASVISSYESSLAIYDNYLKETVTEIVDEAVQKAKQESYDNVREETNKAIDGIADKYLGGSELAKNIIKDTIKSSGAAIKENLPEILDGIGVNVDTLLNDPVFSERINEIVRQYKSVITEEINSELPLGIKVEESQVEKILSDNEATEALVYELLGIKSEHSDTSGVAGFIEKKIIRSIAVRAISMILWAVVFFVINTVLHVIVSIILVIRNIEPVKACDSMIGAVLGLAVGITVIAAGCVIVVLITELTGGMTYMNEAIYDNTYIFGKLYDIISGIIVHDPITQTV